MCYYTYNMITVNIIYIYIYIYTHIHVCIINIYIYMFIIININRTSMRVVRPVTSLGSPVPTLEDHAHRRSCARDVRQRLRLHE